MPDLMADMYSQKGDQLRAGANTAPGSSPTAATLHALHYHQTNVQSVQANIAQTEFNAEFEPLLDDLLTIPVLKTLTGRWKRSDKPDDASARRR